MSVPQVFFLILLTFFPLPLTTLAYADFQEGKAAYDRGDYAKALNEFLPLAEKGNVYSQYALGSLYNFGHGVPQDYEQARKWYLKAAGLGSPQAQFSLGILYSFGRGVPKDFWQAQEWWLKAAGQGMAMAQVNLGLLYEFGEEVPQDYVKAREWYLKAVAQRDANAQYRLGSLFYHGRGVSQDLAKTQKWWLKSATQNLANAQLNLGLLYAHGKGVSKDYIQAHMWVSLAADQGLEKAAIERDKIAKRMTQKQITEAKQLTSEWNPETLEFSEYTVELKKNNTIVHLQGGMGLGVSDKVSQILAAHSDVKGIILDSQGGYIHEGRKLADIIFSQGLDTYSLLGCYSTCTTAFIAGEKRFLGPRANLAFHQYFVAGFKNLQTDKDLEKEQEKDRKFFQQQGVSDEFLQKLFNTPFDDLWYPSAEELLKAQVVHGLVNPSEIFLYDWDGGDSHEIEKTLLAMPVYQTLNKYDPTTFKQLTDALKAQIKEGASPIEIRQTNIKYIRVLSEKALPYTSNEALMKLVKTMVSTMRKLEEKSPILCLKLLLRKEYGEVSAEDYPKNTLASLNEALSRVVIDAYEKDNPQVDIEAATVVMEKIRLKVADDYKSLKPGKLQTSSDYRKFCDLRIKFYELILSENNKLAGNTLRYLFTPK